MQVIARSTKIATEKTMILAEKQASKEEFEAKLQTVIIENKEFYT